MTMQNSTAVGNSYYCGCGTWVSYRQIHTCTWRPSNTTVTPWPNYWQCPACRQQVSGYHICSGPPIYMPVAAPETRPESPLAALVADLRALLAKGQSWLSERKL